MDSAVTVAISPQISEEFGTILVAHLTPNDAIAAWSRVEPYLKMGIEHSRGELTIETVRTLVQIGRMQVWVALHGSLPLGAMLTEVVVYPNATALRVVLLGGVQLRKWANLACTELANFGAQYKIDRIEAIGRKGLVKVLGPLGFEPTYVTLIKEVTHG